MFVLTYFDIFIWTMVIFLGSRGYVNGCMFEILDAIWIIGGVFFASRAGNMIGTYLNDNYFYFESPMMVSIVGFVFGMLIFKVFVSYLASGIKKPRRPKRVKGAPPPPPPPPPPPMNGPGRLRHIDKIMGTVISSAKFFVILSMALFLLFRNESVQKNFEKDFEDAFFFKAMIKTGAFIVHIDETPTDDEATPADEGSTDEEAPDKSVDNEG